MDVKPSESLLNMNNSELPGAGTTKRKELHGTVPVRALAGTWRDKPHGAILYSYRIDFSCDNENFCSFILLTELNLDHDVANAKVDLYLLDTTAMSSVYPSGEVHLDSDQIKRAMRFHELLFNGLFGKLFLGSKAEGTPREFLLQKDSALLWSTNNSYLILPLESFDVENHASWIINWKAVDSCVTVVEYMKSFSWLTAELSERKTRSSRDSSSCLDETCSGKNHVNLANCTFSMGNLKDTVVISIHTGRIYYVLDVLVDTSAHSPFETPRDGKPTKYSTFADYFTKKYEIELIFPGQPLLLLKQTHNPFNLLSDCEATALRRKMLSNGTDQKPQNHVHMPPELVVSIDVPLSVLRAFYLIPSVMHRLECLMLACQLSEEIGLNIPGLLLLEALTTQRCLEDFSSERLELLGDSVLKYSVSCHLFLTYPEKNEGKLSAHRQQAICNATLHYLGIKGGLQEYIRDSPFEPRRWVAPGQLSVHPTSCLHGIDSSKVPLDSKYQTIDEKRVLGKNCDKGHRWLVSKNIADCVEAVIGAYYVAGGLVASIHVMTWLGIEAKLDMGYVDKAVDVASDRPFAQKVDEITTLESKLGYDFSTKGLLLEAITHSTDENPRVKYCYERLEFLGDAVLDVLMTWHLYQNHKDIDPGELTDLRAASVNNENFAQIAVRRNLFPHLQHSSSLLGQQVTEYVNLITTAKDTKTLQGKQCPKALGDLVESIAGAILIDTKLQIEEVWRVFYPLLSPIVTPDNLELAPFRELNELCDRRGYFFKENCVNHDQVIFVELKLQLTDILLIGEGIGRARKAARGEAAFHLLKDLEDRGISYAHVVGKNRKREPHDIKLSPFDGTITLEIVSHKKQKVAQVPIGGVPIISSVSAQKGGPRSSLYELCKRLQWPMPTFETTGRQLITPIEFGEGPNKKKGFNSFTSKISLCIPDFGVMEAVGEERADKKCSQDSAARSLLLELEKLGKLVIGCS